MRVQTFGSDSEASLAFQVVRSASVINRFVASVAILLGAIPAEDEISTLVIVPSAIMVEFNDPEGREIVPAETVSQLLEVIPAAQKEPFT